MVGDVFLDVFAPGGEEWIQIKLVPERTVSAITTQGRPDDFNQYVTSYIIKYSDDGVNFQQIGGVSDAAKLLKVGVGFIVNSNFKKSFSNL